MNYRELADACEAVLNNAGQKSLIAVLESFDRETLVQMCQWNDLNGIHTDEKCMAEFGHTFPTYEYRQTILNAFIATNHVFSGKDDSPKPYIIYPTSKTVQVICGDYRSLKFLLISDEFVVVPATTPRWVEEILSEKWEVL